MINRVEYFFEVSKDNINLTTLLDVIKQVGSERNTASDCRLDRSEIMSIIMWFRLILILE